MHKNNEIQIYQAITETARKWSLPENDQKPCMASLLSSRIPEGLRNLAIHIVVCDLLNRQLKSQAVTETIITKWNDTFEKPLDIYEIKTIIRSASVEKADGNLRTYGCNNNEPLITNNCLGKENCPFYKTHFSNTIKKYSFYSLLNSREFKKLPPSDLKVYLAIVIIERKKGLKAGNTFAVSQRTLEKETGITRQTIAKCLESLHMSGFISFTRGKQHKHNKIASEITRLLPYM